MKTGFLASAFVMAPAIALAHFGLLLPSANMVDDSQDRDTTVTAAFVHPFAQTGLDLVTPTKLGAWHNGQYRDLLPDATDTTYLDAPAFQAPYRLDLPGVHIFTMEPQPYWEPAEDVFIVHYTKTYVAAFGDDAGWDQPVGLKTEILPLTRPFGTWEGSLFQGQVLRDGQPVPNAEVEVEHLNTTGVGMPSELMETLSVRADENGRFSFVASAPGWWGFAALTTADYTLSQDGADKDVELGAVIWVKFEDWP